MLDVKALGDLSAALLTPVIGVVTTIILVNQHRLEKRKLRLQLFEKRYAVYLAAMEYITTIMREGKSTTAAQASFLRDSRDRVFLFDKRIHEFLDDSERYASVTPIPSSNRAVERTATRLVS